MIYTLKKDLNGWKAGDKFSDNDPYIKFATAVDVLDEWFESARSQSWRAKERESYWCVDIADGALTFPDYRNSFDDKNYLSNNYFRTEGQAQEAAIMIRNLLRELRKING